MTNHTLKDALQQAGLTPEEFAEVVRVDPKTVQRWIAGTTTPYRRHRAAISRALGLPESQLWPDRSEFSGGRALGPDPGAPSELSGTWASATADGVPDPRAFVSSANGKIDFLASGRGIEPTGLVAALLEQARAGRQIRVLTSEPTRHLKSLIGQSGIEIRLIHAPAEHSLLRVGDVMLVAFSLAGEADQPPPLFQLTRAGEGGLFDRLASNLQLLWDNADVRVTAVEQLEDYLADLDEGDLGSAAELASDDRSGPIPPTSPDSSRAPRPGATLTRTQQAPRRWPGRRQ